MNETSFKTSAALILPMLLSSLLVSGCSTQNNAVQQELGALKQSQNKMELQLAAIEKQLKERPAANPRQTPPFNPQDISIKGIQWLGNNDAPVALVEFTDYQCPFCLRHAQDTAPSIIKNFVDSGKIRYGVRELPLVTIHPTAFEQAQAAICGGQQGKYWAMHDLFFEKTVSDFEASARTANLDMEKFEKCMADKTIEERVNADIDTASKLGIKGTPGFIFGKFDNADSDTLRAEKFLSGAQPYTSFKTVIEEVSKN